MKDTSVTFLKCAIKEPKIYILYEVWDCIIPSLDLSYPLLTAYTFTSIEERLFLLATRVVTVETVHRVVSIHFESFLF